VFEPDTLFQVAGCGMLLSVACSLWLRSSIEPSTALFADLFGRPVLADRNTKPWLLRGKYFLPWVGGPAGLGEYSLFSRILFLGARFGAMLLIVGVIGFFARAFWDVAH
jgi:hypothetical protein